MKSILVPVFVLFCTFNVVAADFEIWKKHEGLLSWVVALPDSAWTTTSAVIDASNESSLTTAKSTPIYTNASKSNQTESFSSYNHLAGGGIGSYAHATQTLEVSKANLDPTDTWIPELSYNIGAAESQEPSGATYAETFASIPNAAAGGANHRFLGRADFMTAGANAGKWRFRWFLNGEQLNIDQYTNVISTSPIVTKMDTYHDYAAVGDVFNVRSTQGVTCDTGTGAITSTSWVRARTTLNWNTPAGKTFKFVASP